MFCIENHVVVGLKTGIQIYGGKICGIGVGTEECWKKTFKMSRESFMRLSVELNPFVSPNPSSPNFRAISAEEKL